MHGIGPHGSMGRTNRIAAVRPISFPLSVEAITGTLMVFEAGHEERNSRVNSLREPTDLFNKSSICRRWKQTPFTGEG